MNIFNVKNKYHFYLLKMKKKSIYEILYIKLKKKIYLKMEPKIQIPMKTQTIIMKSQIKGHGNQLH